MKSPLFQFLLFSLVLGVGLWAGVKWFLHGTHEYSHTLDANSASYRRDEPAGSSLASAEVAKPADSPADSLELQPATPAVFAPADPNDLAEEATAEEAQQAEESDEADGDAEDDTDGTEDETEDEAEDEAEDENVSESLEQAEGSPQDEAIRLSEDEIEARENARLKRLAAFGLVTKKPLSPTIAIDASLVIPDACSGAAVARVPVGLKFRHESSIIRGESLNALESLVALYRDCDQGAFVLAENPLGREDATEALTQMRFDEVKYFFIQHSVSTDVVQFPEIK